MSSPGPTGFNLGRGGGAIKEVSIPNEFHQTASKQRSLLNDRKEGQGQESDFSGSHRNRLFVAAGSCPSGPTLATRLRQRTDTATVFTTLSCKRLPCEIWIDFHSSQFNTSNSRWLGKNTSWSLKIIKVIQLR